MMVVITKLQGCSLLRVRRSCNNGCSGHGAELGAGLRNPHNAARSDVGVGPVSWDDTVAAYAESYAAQRQGDCALEHSDSGGKYGENIFWGSAGGDWTAASAVSSWVAEKQWYDHDSNSCSAPAGSSCGHYTQVVWSNSTAIGCARVVCDNSHGVFITCNYSPPGNYNGKPPY
uniref:SCP domain-containing protein n=1 Tax=Oryza rufipogon TaxID=4529 RepID=A0A0E0Q3M4_ORYRU